MSVRLRIRKYFNQHKGISLSTKDKDMISKGEKACKSYVQRLFKRSFTKIRPDFLKDPKTKRNLELDLYNDSLKLGIEYNGIQHYEYTERFHKNYSDFSKQKARVALKKQLCKENGVTLIVVPYVVDCIPSYLLRCARRLFPERFPTSKV